MVLTTYVSMWCIRLGVTLTRLAEVCCVPCVVTASWQELQNVTAARLWAASSLTCPTSQGPKQHAHQEKKSSGGLKIDHQWDYGTLLQLASDGIHGAGWPRSCIPSQSHPALTVLGGACGPGPLRCAGAQFRLRAPGAARHLQGFGVNKKANRYNQIGNGQK